MVTRQHPISQPFMQLTGAAHGPSQLQPMMAAVYVGCIPWIETAILFVGLWHPFYLNIFRIYEKQVFLFIVPYGQKCCKTQRLGSNILQIWTNRWVFGRCFNICAFFFFKSAVILSGKVMEHLFFCFQTRVSSKKRKIRFKIWFDRVSGMFLPASLGTVKILSGQITINRSLKPTCITFPRVTASVLQQG